MDYDYDEDIVGEAPCEFCGLPFPLMLLIEHQTIHLAEEHYQFLDEIPNNTVTENIIRETQIIEEKKLGSAAENEAEIIEEKKLESAAESELKIAIEEKQAQSLSGINEPKIAISKQKQSSVSKDEKKENEKIKEFTTGSGEKLLVYGSGVDAERDLDNDKQIYKMPNNPLLSNLCKEKDIEDINNLSDDDSSESLEEFWKRARDVLKRSRVKSECS